MKRGYVKKVAYLSLITWFTLIATGCGGDTANSIKGLEKSEANSKPTANAGVDISGNIGKIVSILYMRL